MEKHHKTIRELLPWLVNGSLEGRERERVLDHLRACADCRAERDALQRLQTAVATAPAPDTHHVLSHARVSRRIDAWEAERENGAAAHRIGFAWRSGIAAALVVSLGLVLQMNETDSGQSELAGAPDAADTYETMTPPGAAITNYRVAVTMHAGTDANNLRGFLIEHAAGLVTGPDAHGTYVLDLPSVSGEGPREVLAGVRESSFVASAELVAE